MSPEHPSRIDGSVLVTGGTGFLGRETVQQLVACGADVHVLARRDSARGPLASLQVTWHEGDLRDAGSIERAFAALARAAQGSDRPPRAIHAAALISYRTRDGDLAREINVEGTRRVIEACRRHGFARLVHVSSVVTIGHCAGPDPIDETAKFNNGGLGVDYVDTKRAAEDLVLAASSGLDAVVVNPGAIFGPVERSSNTVRLIRRLAAGRPPPFVPPGSVGVLGVRDAASGTLLALQIGRRGERYLLVESNLASAELFRRISRILGMPPVERVLSPWVWRALTRLAVPWDALSPMQLTPPQALTMLGLDLRFDAAKARRELGWRPASFDSVLAETIEHVQSSRGEYGRG
ncbi:MAG: NAD-dependent epimerase/dehydratase family protein [Planctomycetota bacterium]